jgi:hypothetical protein
MRLTSTGLGIGTSSPAYKLDVSGVSRVGGLRQSFETGLYTTDGALSNYSATNGVYLTGNAAGWLALQASGAQATQMLLYGPTEASLPNVIIAKTNSVERLRIASTGAFGLSGANYGTSGQVLTSGGSGAAPTWTTVGGGSSQWTTSGTSIYYSTGNVGINTSVPGSKLSIQPGTVTSIGVQNQCGITIENGNGATTNLSQIGFGYTNTGTTSYVPSVMGFVNTATAGSTAGALFFATREATTDSAPTERMRIDAAGRVGIGTTAATTNIARLEIDHLATDRYGIYVPGNIYTGSGTAGANYGGYFRSNTSNSGTTDSIGVFGAPADGPASTQYGIYGDGRAAASSPVVGVYGKGRQSDLNGPGAAYGGWFNANTASSSAGGSGSTYAVRAENTSTTGNNGFGVYASTVSGPSNINGYYYEHNGSLLFRVKSNGGIDNYSGNNTNLSDRREKKDFAPAKSYLETICSIPVQTFKYIEQEDDLPNLGVVAQDVQAVAPELVNESNWGSKEEPKVRLSVYETDLMYALMKSIQELNAKFDEYKASHP